MLWQKISATAIAKFWTGSLSTANAKSTREVGSRDGAAASASAEAAAATAATTSLFLSLSPLFSLSLPVYLSICLSIYLSIYLYLFPSLLAMMSPYCLITCTIVLSQSHNSTLYSMYKYVFLPSRTVRGLTRESSLTVVPYIGISLALTVIFQHTYGTEDRNRDCIYISHLHLNMFILLYDFLFDY